MKFHSDLFGWEYVWRNFAEEKAGTVVTDTGEEEGKLKYLSIPVTDSNSNSGCSAGIFCTGITSRQKSAWLHCCYFLSQQ